MKNLFTKKITFFTLAVTAFQFYITPLKSLAVDTITYTPLESGVFDGFGEGIASGSSDLSVFLGQAFQFGLAIAAALTVIMIVWGGVEYMLTDSVFSKEDGKKKIKEALLGLGLALVSWLILYIINPDILNFKI